MMRRHLIGLVMVLLATACSNDTDPASTVASVAAIDTSPTSSTEPETTTTADMSAEGDAPGGGSGTALTILEWNITGGEVAANAAIVADVFATEDTDIVVLQETNRGAATISDILGERYTLVVALDGQEIWIKNDGRLIVGEINMFAFEGGCNGFDLGTPSVTLEDTQSNGELVHLYSTHLCIPDGFGRATRESADALPDISNENQQQHMCSLIENMEMNAATGTVVLAADFNDINLSAGESIVEFLQGSGSLNAGFCESTELLMTEVIVTDVTGIMGSGGSDMYHDQHSVNRNEIGFGQHGYVVAAIDLGDRCC